MLPPGVFHDDEGQTELVENEDFDTFYNNALEAGKNISEAEAKAALEELGMDPDTQPLSPPPARKAKGSAIASTATATTGTFSYAREYADRLVRKKERPNDKTEKTFIDLKGLTSYCGIPIEDLAQEVVDSDKGFLGVGPSGAGKTEFIKRLVYLQWLKDKTTDYNLFTHKDDGDALDYAGLEACQNCYVMPSTQRGDKLRAIARKVESQIKVLTRMLDGQPSVPMVVIYDQSNSGIKACNNASRMGKDEMIQHNRTCDPEDKWDTRTWDFQDLPRLYDDLIESGWLDGRSKGFRVWNFSHLNTTSGTGQDHQVKEGVYYIGLGRKTITSALYNPVKNDLFIPDNAERKELKERLETFMKHHRSIGSPANVVIAITDYGGEGWKIVVLPQQEARLPRIELGPTNPPIDASSYEYDRADGIDPVSGAPTPDDSGQYEIPMDSLTQSNEIERFRAQLQNAGESLFPEEGPHPEATPEPEPKPPEVDVNEILKSLKTAIAKRGKKTFTARHILHSSLRELRNIGLKVEDIKGVLEVFVKSGEVKKEAGDQYSFVRFKSTDES